MISRALSFAFLFHRIIFMLMQFNRKNVFIVINPSPFCIPLLSVKRLSPSLIKLFPGLTKQTIRTIHQQWPRNFLECCIMEMTKKRPKFNYCLFFAKYFLYCQKLSSKKCDFNEFIKKLLLQLRVENLL